MKPRDALRWAIEAGQMLSIGRRPGAVVQSLPAYTRAALSELKSDDIAEIQRTQETPRRVRLPFHVPEVQSK